MSCWNDCSEGLGGWVTCEGRVRGALLLRIEVKCVDGVASARRLSYALAAGVAMLILSGAKRGMLDEFEA